jgi:TonB family protein
MTLSGRAAVGALAGLVCLGASAALLTADIGQIPPSQAVRVGGDVRPPQKTKDVRPIYPPQALAAGIEGVVILEATIGVDGRVIGATVLRGVPMLDEPALDAVRQWEYTPTTLFGAPVAVLMTVTVNFSLGGRGAGRGIPAPGAAPPNAPPTPTPTTDGPVTVVGFVGGDARLVIVSRLGLEIWDVNRKSLLRRQTISPAYSPLGRVLSPDGRLLAMQMATSAPAGGGEGGRYETRFVNVETGAISRLAPDTGSGNTHLAFSADGRTFARVTSTNRETTVHAWRLPSLDLLSEVVLRFDDLGATAFGLSPNGDRFAVSSHLRTPENLYPPMPYGRIRVLDTQSRRILSTIEVPESPRVLQFSSDGQELFWAHDGDDAVWVSDLASARQASEMDGNSRPGRSRNPSYARGGVPGSIFAMAQAANTPRLFAASRTTRTTQIWDSDGRILTGTVRAASEPWSIAASTNGRFLAVGTSHGVQVFDVTLPASAVNVFETGPLTVGTGPGGVPAPIPFGEFGAGAYRLGPVITVPVPIKMPSPTYTPDARRARIEGVVELEVVVREDGTIGDVRVVRSLDTMYGLDQEAIRAAKQWTFLPARGPARQPIPVVVRLELTFRLRD